MKYVVLASQRSGSVFLERCLNSHPDIHCYGELMLGNGGYRDVPVPTLLNKQRRLRHLYSMARTGVAFRPFSYVKGALDERDESAVGFRMMHAHTRRSVVSYLRSVEANVIFLERRNLLRQAISHEVMRSRQRTIGAGSAHSTTAGFSETITIEPLQLIGAIDALVADQATAKREFRGARSMDLFYEDLPLPDGRLVSELNLEICNFLGIKEIPMKSNSVRTGGVPLKELLANHDEVISVVMQTPHSRFLDLEQSA